MIAAIILADFAKRRRRLADSRAAEDHNRLLDFVLAEQQFGLEVVNLQAHAAQVLFCKKLGIGIGRTVTRAFENRLHPLRGIGILFDCLWQLPRQLFATIDRMSGCRDLLIFFHRLSIIPACRWHLE